MEQTPQQREQPRQERAQRSRRVILEAARTAFAKGGYEGANIRHIAEQVGVTHTLIRYHFGNKHELWKAVVDDMFDRLSASMSPEQTGHLDLRTPEGMKAWLRFYIRYCADNPDHVRMMIQESMSESERLGYMVSRIKRSHKGLIPVFQRLMSDGVVPDVWLVSFFYIISSICQMPFVLSTAINRLYEVDMTSEAAIEAHADAVIALILGERSVPPAQWPPLPQWAVLAQAKAEDPTSGAA
ncbi:MAG: TetR/AcrR family transcriptional regulator [Erythrobacter sp.]|jgi:AcrR family transcriptional regulator|nr:TetR/AcrR family transcriptional regulator [Erythrobacter sp.]